ncbi:branched-chain amino acid aminotransferase [Peribacillus cavernae]|uniref:Branched-chain amino acid aminotransferase n=1 Tax=Peribacillus cavernae TaxID=1674310 RepID=A0A3S0UGG5_9BACI|nr:branched-chain amino acid aminotransferase [Peribacillus cavernae]MDQ0220652.1 hypothetical protein [Peribacillus cavernae]RUQ31108.1 branched-chain amino acid aminotransferase [Peribacillus cavernae]
MLKNQVKQHLAEEMKKSGEQQLKTIEIYKEEKEYAEKYHLIPENMILVEKNSTSRFSNAYIERCDKESEEVLAEETPAFLNQPIAYFKKHMNEFMYLESSCLAMIGIDAISLETDNVFGIYDVMLGLKLQKKFEAPIKDYLEKELHGDEAAYELLFIQDDGLWDLNFTLNYADGFKEDISIGDAYRLIYRFLFKLVESVEEGN